MTLPARIRQLEAQRVEAAKQARTVARLDALEEENSNEVQAQMESPKNWG